MTFFVFGAEMGFSYIFAAEGRMKEKLKILKIDLKRGF